MTREDAIACLKGMKNYARDTFTEQSDWQNSLDMAIKALEQIAMLDRLTEMYAHKGHNPIRTITMADLRDLLK